MTCQKTYVQVVLPLKLNSPLTYSVPEEMCGGIAAGSWVKASVRGNSYIGTVSAVTQGTDQDTNIRRITPISEILDRKPVTREEMDFWKEVSEYCMCSVGEVFKAAYNAVIQRESGKAAGKGSKASGDKKKGKDDCEGNPQLNVLSEAQDRALSETREAFSQGRRVLLHGVTGSGKTEIYMHLAAETMKAGRQVLYLVPEIAISRQLQQRISQVFGNRMLTYHSKMTVPSRRKVIDAVSDCKDAGIVIGTRSAVFLPFQNLGLIIVDEEHDQSYKQDDPAPRYNGRDMAIMLSAVRGANLILGSATPSYEALYNVSAGKFTEISLTSKYFGNVPPVIRTVDTNRERRLGNMRGSFSVSVLKEMEKALADGGQVMVFRSRRSYAPYVQCTECGAVAKCPHCNVSLSYHRQSNMLSCHYCGYKETFTTRCKECGEPALAWKGAGTEKIEEELQALFPGRKVSRFDAETTTSKVREQQILSDFAAHKTDIMVGTQMITKGFDFEKLSLVVLLNADSLFAVQDFRSDERAVQLISQLLGRSGRRNSPGRLVIQCAQPDNPALNPDFNAADGMRERQLFRYPPYVRLITIKVKDANEGRLWNACRLISDALRDCGMNETNGPVIPDIPVVDNKMVREFWIRLDRSRNYRKEKNRLYERICAIIKELKGGTQIVIDVDPM